jgi:hypothetical protein
MSRRDHPVTPDGRYFVARGRLWRRTDPRLPDSDRRAAIKSLMQARLALRSNDSPDARARIDAAKRALGETGPVWWQDGAPDETDQPPEASSYADWWRSLRDGP